MNEITNAIVQILSDCIITRDVKVETLATFDIEYLFLMFVPSLLVRV